MSRQPLEPVPDRNVSQHAELIFDYWCADALEDAIGKQSGLLASKQAILHACLPEAEARISACQNANPRRMGDLECVCSDVNGNGPLESTLRSYRALALQLMRRTVTPENRPDAVRGVICMTYMVSHQPPPRPLSNPTLLCSCAPPHLQLYHAQPWCLPAPRAQACFTCCADRDLPVGRHHRRAAGHGV